MEDIEALIARMRLAMGEGVDDPVAQARTAILAHVLSVHIAAHDPDEQGQLRRMLEGLTRAMEELGPKAYLDELFARADEIAATRH